MTDELREALADYDRHDGASLLSSHFHQLAAAARRWASFPTDEDIEAVANVIYAHHYWGEHPPSQNAYYFDKAKEQARAVLLAVKDLQEVTL